MNILVLDDEKTIVHGILHHITRLDGLNANAVGAYSADEALERWNTFAPIC